MSTTQTAAPGALAHTKHKAKRPWRLFTIRFKFALFTGLVIATLMSVVGYSLVEQQRAALTREVLGRGRTIAQNLANAAHDPMLTKDDLTLAALLGRAPGDMLHRPFSNFVLGPYQDLWHRLRRYGWSSETNPRKTQLSPNSGTNDGVAATMRLVDGYLARAVASTTVPSRDWSATGRPCICGPANTLSNCARAEPRATPRTSS